MLVKAARGRANAFDYSGQGGSRSLVSGDLCGLH